MSWLKLKNGELVNLDHVASVKNMDLYRISGDLNDRNKNVVALFAANDHDTVYEGCIGSYSMCEDYMQALQEYIEAKEILAVDHILQINQMSAIICGLGYFDNLKKDAA